MRWRELHINDTARVRLTNWGLSVVLCYYEDAPNLVPRSDLDGWREFQLWNLFDIFGRYMGRGSRQVFVDNRIQMRGEKVRG